MATGWRVAAVADEALSNVLSSPLRLLLLGTAIGAMGAGLCWMELSSLGEAAASEARFAHAGGYVAVVSGDEPISMSACARLSSVDGVDAAGGVRGASEVSSATSPSVRFARLEVSQGVVAVWQPASRSAPGHIGVGSAAASELGIGRDDWVELGEAGRGRVAVIDPLPRNPFAARSIIDVVPPVGRADECWVAFSRATFDAGVAMLAAAFAPQEVSVRRVAERGEFAVEPAAQVAGRITVWAWVPAALVIVAMYALTALFRRADVAVYRAYGLPGVGVLVMHQVEVGVVTLIATVAGTAWALALYATLVAIPDTLNVGSACATVLNFAGAVVAIAPAMAAWTGAGSPAALLKDR